VKTIKLRKLTFLWFLYYFFYSKQLLRQNFWIKN